MLNNISHINNRQMQTLIICICALIVCLTYLLGIEFGSSTPIVEFFSAEKKQFAMQLEGLVDNNSLVRDSPELPLWLMYVLGVLIMLFGVPHGALDFDLATRKIPLHTRTQKCGFMFLYSLLASTCVVLWYYLPALMLCVFLAISIWHFAADWELYLPTYLCLLTALWILTLPALLQPEVFINILSMLWISSKEGHFLQWVFSLISVICTLVLLLNWRTLINKGYSYVFELIAYLLLLTFSHVLVFFTLYFCIIHSASYLMRYYRNITQQKIYLIMQISGIMLLTVILGAGIVFFSQSYGIETHFYTWLFVGLFALTTPHMLLVEKYFKAN